MSTAHAEILAREEYRAFVEDATLPIPEPEDLRRVGSFERRDFLQVAAILFENVKQRCALRPGDRVLDVGCGWGRFALPLTRYLSGEGRYVGVDVASRAIGWCTENVTAYYPNFTFRHVDARNSYANSGGAIPAHEARLLEEPEGFDVIVATSLFTHMLAPDMENYFRQMAALCRPGGSLYATFFLLDPETERLCAEGVSRHRFPGSVEVARISNPEIPEDAVAYPADYVVDRLSAAGFAPEVLKGFWSGRPEGGFDYQDVLVARRLPAAR